jgi:hypothetical protein
VQSFIESTLVEDLMRFKGVLLKEVREKRLQQRNRQQQQQPDP